MFKRKSTAEKLWSFPRGTSFGVSLALLWRNPVEYIASFIAAKAFIGKHRPLYHPSRIFHWSVVGLLFFWIFGERTVHAIKLVSDETWIKFIIVAVLFTIYSFVYNWYQKRQEELKPTKWQCFKSYCKYVLKGE